MANVTRKLVLAQYSSPGLHYTVVEVQNSTDPKVGDDLSEREVKDLINRGFQVVIRAPKAR